MDKKALKEGIMIKAPFLDGIGLVKKFEDNGSYFKLELVLKKNNKYISLQLDDGQLDSIEEAGGSSLFVESSEDFFLNVEAERIRLAYEFDPILAVTTSQIQPLPHQIEAVYDYALQSPKVRFLIADDAGAGKTVMAGLIIKELQYRRMANRILIVVPGHLKYQWQREMKEKFDTNFTLINRDLMRSSMVDVWETNNHCISTIDFLKQDDILNSLKGNHWDLVVADEAHKMSAYKYGDKIDKTGRYKVGEILSENSTHMLFLTATPHRGKKDNFRLFLDLLRPGFFSDPDLMDKSIDSKENRLFIRRLKEDMRNFDGEPLFPPRDVRSVEFNLSDEEKRLYNDVTSYIQNYYDQAKENRHISFAMMILQRRLTSSINAILESLKNRREGLNELLSLPEKIESSDEYEEARGMTEEEIEDLEEEKRMEIEDKMMQLTIANNVDEVEEEILQVEKLITEAREVKKQEIESKLVKLHDEVLENLEGRKLLIFTEFKDTLDYLVDKLEDWDFDVTQIHGKMGMEARIEAEREFRENCQIMVATEAAGEGINLQFCSLMVNYDIPWNPNRLTQRMGRVHRYGQENEVFIWNMIAKETREGQILSRLFSKLETIKEDLGGNDRVFDIIGDVIPGADFGDLFKQAIFDQRKMDEINQEIEKTDKESVQTTLDNLQFKGLATRHIDYSGVSEKRREAAENKLIPEYIEDYFLRAFKRFGGEVKKVRDYYRIENVPYDIRSINEDSWFKRNYGRVEKRYSRITFSKDIAQKDKGYEYVAPGHPLLEAVNQKILNMFEGQEVFAKFVDENGNKNGVIWFFEGSVSDGLHETVGKSVFAVYQGKDGEIKEINPSVMWDLKPMDEGDLVDARDLLNDKGEVEDYISKEILFPYRDKLKERRKKETHIKKKYGLRSLQYLIQESNSKLIEYDQRQEAGEDMKMAIFNEEQRKERFEKRKDQLQKEIRLEKNLTVSNPSFIGGAVVVPGEKEPKAAAGMYSDEEVEAVGMKVAMEYEKSKGWNPEDVSSENIGFDIRSVKYNGDGKLVGIRYIEVKARAQEGGVRLSANEWKKAKRFSSDYWLYIVTNAGSGNPVLSKRIQDPTDKFSLNENIYATGYEIPLENWKQIEG